MTEQVVTLFQSLLGLILVLGITAISLLGWGRLTLRLIGLELCKRPDTITIWFGYGVVLGLTDFWHLFFSIDWKASLFVCLVGIIGCLVGPALNWTNSTLNIYRKISQNPIGTIFIVVILILWCLRAMGTPNNFDSGLYHFGTIRWINEYPLVPGLGNLHWRFAFNQSHFNFLALLNLAPFWGKGYASGGLFLLILAMATLIEMCQKQKQVWRWAFGGIFFIYFGYVASGVVNPAPDGVIGLVQVVSFILLFRILHYKNDLLIEASAQIMRDISTLIVLCLSMTTIKLTGAIFALASLTVGLWSSRFILKRNLGRMFLLGIFILIFTLIHLVRGYLLSGYPLFPGSLFGAQDLPWTMNIEFIKFESDLIKSWARVPGKLDPSSSLASWDWILEWINAMSFWNAVLLSSAVVSILLTCLLLLMNKKQGINGNLYIAYLPVIASLIFWFFIAPDLRFLGATLVIILALSGGILATYIQEVLKSNKIHLINSGNAMAIVGVCCIYLITLKLTGLNSISLIGWKKIPSQATEEMITMAGLTVKIPTIGASCWNELLPCASVFNGNLNKRNIKFFKLNTIGIMNNFYFLIESKK